MSHSRRHKHEATRSIDSDLCFHLVKGLQTRPTLSHRRRPRPAHCRRRRAAAQAAPRQHGCAGYMARPLPGRRGGWCSPAVGVTPLLRSPQRCRTVSNNHTPNIWGLHLICFIVVPQSFLTPLHELAVGLLVCSFVTWQWTPWPLPGRALERAHAMLAAAGRPLGSANSSFLAFSQCAHLAERHHAFESNKSLDMHLNSSSCTLCQAVYLPGAASALCRPIPHLSTRGTHCSRCTWNAALLGDAALQKLLTNMCTCVRACVCVSVCVRACVCTRKHTYLFLCWRITASPPPSPAANANGQRVLAVLCLPSACGGPRALKTDVSPHYDRRCCPCWMHLYDSSV
jgi:hypothetical protein